MAHKKLTLEALRSLDGGRVAEAFDQALERLRQDCIDRPALGAPRKVQLVVEMKPIADQETSELDSVDVRFDVKEVSPPRKSRGYNMAAKDGGLFFNELSPERANQGTFEALDGDEDGKSSRAGA